MFKDLKPSPIPQEKPVFEKNETRSYRRAFERKGTVILDSYGEYSIFGLMRLFPRNLYIKDYIEKAPHIKEYRILNHLSIAPNIYKMEEPLIYAVARKDCKYHFEKIDGIENSDFLETMLQIIISTYRYCDEMMAIVMDCSEEDAAKDFVPHIKWGIIVNSADKTAMLLDKESAAVQFHKRFRLIKNTFLK